jgi:hypothetical protein
LKHFICFVSLPKLWRSLSLSAPSHLSVSKEFFSSRSTETINLPSFFQQKKHFYSKLWEICVFFSFAASVVVLFLSSITRTRPWKPHIYRDLFVFPQN